MRSGKFIGLSIVILGLSMAGQTLAAQSASRVDPDGTAHVQELAIPPSSLWSPEFKQFYIDRVVKRAPYPVPPPPGSPKAAWDEFDRLQNQPNVELVARAKERYAVSVEEKTIAGVRTAIVTPKTGVAAKNKHRVLINLRGSGFIANRGLLFGQMESIPVAAIGGFKVITLDYRQAPYDSYPAATEDVAAVYAELLKSYKPDAIGIYGCSAGGLLAAQAVAWLADKKQPRPGAVGVLCMSLSAPPEKDGQFYGAGDSALLGAASNVPLYTEVMDAMRKIPPYMATADKNDPRAWPGASDAVLARFPPTLFLVGTREGFMSTAIVDHARMTRLGVDASLYVMEGAPHAAHVTGVGTPEAHDANLAIARFFDKHLARK